MQLYVTAHLIKVQEHVPCVCCNVLFMIFVVDCYDDTDFNEYENVELAFQSLLTKLQDNVPESQLDNIKRGCIAATDKKLGQHIRTKANNVASLFILLSQHKFCFNWFNTHLVDMIVIGSGNKKLKNLVDRYKESIYSRKLHQVLRYIPEQPLKTKYYEEIRARFFPQDPDNVTVRDLIKYNDELVNNIALLPMTRVVVNCLSITWLVPTDKAYQLFLFALTMPQQSRQDDYLQIGNWMVYHPQSVLQKLKMEFG